MPGNASGQVQRKLSEAEFRLLLRLTTKQQWLEQKQIELLELMALCKTIDEQTFVCDLLYEFTHLSGADLASACDKIVEKICDGWQLLPERTRVVAQEETHDADGSKLVMAQLRHRFDPAKGWTKANFEMSLPQACHWATDGDSIVLIDDFCGTGETVEGQCNWAAQKLLDRGVASARIFFCAVAAMEFSQPVFASIGVPFFSPHWLKKGISDRYTGAKLSDAIKFMKDLEAELSKPYGKKAWQSLGYKQSETLYGYEGTAPDNVFPIFWWAWLKNNAKRNPLLRRLPG